MNKQWQFGVFLSDEYAWLTGCVTGTAWEQAYNDLVKLNYFLKKNKIGFDLVRTSTSYWTQQGKINCKIPAGGQTVMCLFYTKKCPLL